jgi:thiosulfate dehydrogenase [quinone] large subunit
MTQTIETKLFGSDLSLEFNGAWAAYWLFIIRVLTGWWLLHAGLSKLYQTHVLGEPFSAGWFVKFAASGTILEPVMNLFANPTGIAFTNFMIPIGQFLIGVGILFGVLTRLAAFFGAFLMFFFYFINAGWAHGMLSSELMGFLLFVTIAVFGAGRVWGIDQYLEKMDWAQNRFARLLMG